MSLNKKYVIKNDYEKLYLELNEDINLENYSINSHKRVNWKCSVCGHEWVTEIRVRARLGCGCPRCNGNRTGGNKGFNRVSKDKSLGVKYPTLLSMWNYEKNVQLDPYCIAPCSELEVWWKCDRGHEYKRKINYQSRRSQGCPECLKGFSSSFPELVIYYVCCEVFGEDRVLHRDKDVFGFEIDVLVPDVKLGFEFGSWYWHKDKYDLDLEKFKILNTFGYHLFTLYSDIDSNEFINMRNVITFKHSITYENNNLLFDVLENILNISIDRSKRLAILDLVINNSKYIVDYKNSFEFNYPNAVKEWDYEKNFPLTPADVNKGSNNKFFFVCDKGHSYESKPCKKISRGDGCPYCAVQKIGEDNNFAVLNPELMDFWDWDKNEEDPYKISTTCTTKKVWYWKCPECDYEWNTTTSHTLIDTLERRKNIFGRKYLCKKCKR